MTLKTGIYPGSFDPLTNGHLSIIKAASRIVDKLIIAIGIHHEKTGFIPVEKRLSLLTQSCQRVPELQKIHIEIITFDNLVVDLAKEQKAHYLFRGLRDARDFEYEMQMVGMNAAMYEDLQTIFLPAEPHTRHITATLVRQIHQMGGDISDFVPEPVKTYLNRSNK